MTLSPLRGSFYRRCGFLSSGSFLTGRPAVNVPKNTPSYYSIQIFDEKGKNWNTNFTNDAEAIQFLKEKCVSRDTFSYTATACVTVRMDTVQNFAKDFFFPMAYEKMTSGPIVTHHLSSTTLSPANTVPAILMAAVLDLLTLPIRLLTLIPRFIYLKKFTKQEEHPLYREIRQSIPDFSAEKAEVHIFAYKHHINQTTMKMSYNLNFRDLPFYHDHKYGYDDRETEFCILSPFKKLPAQPSVKKTPPNEQDLYQESLDFMDITSPITECKLENAKRRRMLQHYLDMGKKVDLAFDKEVTKHYNLLSEYIVA